jgi:site-specific DNA-methyltransferase (adenine-specific)
MMNIADNPHLHKTDVTSSAVYMEDCVIGMKRYPDKFFNLAIVDVPYTDEYKNMQNLNTDMKGKQAKVGQYHYNSLSNAKPTKEYWDELKRVSKNQIVWGANYLIEYLNSTPCVIVWDKNNSGNFADCEIAFATFTTGAKIFKYTWNGMIQQNMKDKEERIHPTQKPVALYEWLLNQYAKDGDLILDTHVGSGSSRIACYKNGFSFVGFEIDKTYFEAQEARFKNFTSQTTLW